MMRWMSRLAIRPFLLTTFLAMQSQIALAQHSKVITDHNVVSERLKEFQSDLKGLGLAGHIETCGHLVEIAVGGNEGNLSYGAICALTTPKGSRPILVCDDEMFGHFALTSDFTMTNEAVTQFVMENCFGG